MRLTSSPAVALSLCGLMLVGCSEPKPSVVTDDPLPHPMEVEGFMLVDDLEFIGCETASGWSIVNPQNGGTDGASLTTTEEAAEVIEGTGALELVYPVAAGKPIALVRTVSLVAMESLAISLRSESDADVKLLLGLADGAFAAHDVSLQAGIWSNIEITADVLALAPDGPQLSATLILIDTAYADPDTPSEGAGLSNTLWVDDLRVDRPELWEKAGDWHIDGRELTVREPARLLGDLDVTAGGNLRIESEHFELAGHATVDAATLELSGCRLDVPEEFRQQYGLELLSGGRLDALDSSIVSPFPFQIHARDASTLLFDGYGHSPGSGGLHVDTGPDGFLTIRNSDFGGEITLIPSSEILIDSSQNVLVWFFAPQGTSATLELPDGANVTTYTAASPFDVTVINSTSIQWAIVSFTGSDLTVLGSSIRGAGIQFSSPDPVTVSGLYNNQPVPDLSMLSDRTLDLTGSTVTSWTFYPGGTANVTIEDSLFGELMTFQDSTATVRNAACDGTGGFFAALDNSSITVEGTNLTSRVASYNAASISFDGSSIVGAIQASGQSIITLANTSHVGERVTFDDAQIVVSP